MHNRVLLPFNPVRQQATREIREERGKKRIYRERSQRGSISIRASLISANESTRVEKFTVRKRSPVSLVLYWISSRGPIKHSRNVTIQSFRIVRPKFEATRGAPKVLSHFYIAHDFSVCTRTTFLCWMLVLTLLATRK